MTSYFHKAKEHGIQGQLNGRYCITYTPGRVAVQFNQHGNCTTATVATLMLGMFQVVCISKISVELTTCHNGRCFTASVVKRSHSIPYHDSLFNFTKMEWHYKCWCHCDDITMTSSWPLETSQHVHACVLTQVVAPCPAGPCRLQLLVPCVPGWESAVLSFLQRREYPTQVISLYSYSSIDNLVWAV